MKRFYSCFTCKLNLTNRHIILLIYCFDVKLILFSLKWISIFQKNFFFSFYLTSKLIHARMHSTIFWTISGLPVLFLQFLALYLYFIFFAGECVCLPGWRGGDCSEPCEHDTFGYNCLQQCHCLNHASCRGNDGFCECLPGWMGPGCSQSKSTLPNSYYLLVWYCVHLSCLRVCP